MTITAEQLQEWRVACKKVPTWSADVRWHSDMELPYLVLYDLNIRRNNFDNLMPVAQNIADFAQIARSALPALLDEVERLRALLRAWDAKCAGHCDTEDVAAQVEALK